MKPEGLLLHSEVLFLHPGLRLRSLRAVEEENRIRALNDAVAHLQMPAAKMCPRTLTPGAHEVIIQSSTNQRAGNRNYSPRPLLYYFPAGLNGNALDDAGNKFIDDFFFQKLAADVNSSCAGGGDPKFGRLFVRIEFETVQQAELLNRAQSNARQDAQIRNNRYQSA